MKATPHKFLLLLIFLLYNLPIAHTQQLGGKSENQNISQFIRIWGLVKYRSQKSISGEFDADKVFLEMIDSVKYANRHQFNLLMLRLTADDSPKSTINGQVYRKTKRVNGPYLVNNVNYDWTRNKSYTPLLKAQLTELTAQANTSGQHHYLPEVWYEGDLPNEATYADYTFENEGMNLLALAKAWNAVEYLFPYKYVMDSNWKDILMEMIPVFRKINDRAGYEKGALMLAAATNDTHAAAFMSPANMKMANAIFDIRYYPPFDYIARENGLVITKFLNDSLAKSTPLRPGDKIVAINGIKVNQWLSDRSALLPASNDEAKYRALSTTNNNRGDAFAFSHLEDKVLQVSVRRQGVKVDLELELLDRQNKTNVRLIGNHISQEWESGKMIKGREDIDHDIVLFRAGYLYDKDLPEDEDMEKLSTELKSKKAIIIDMRKYPQSPGFFSYYLPMLLGKAPFAFARYYTADLRQVGIFRYKKELDTYMYVPKDETKPIGDLYTGQLVILTNEHTQSMGEWFTMMLRQLNCHTAVIGSQTAGADGDVRRITLPGNYQFSFTGNGIFYPDGRETQRIGILPDIYFEPSVEDLAGTGDAQLQRAIKYIREGL